MLPAMKVEIYSKSDCSLCEQALAVVERVRARRPFTLTVVDVRTDPVLWERHRYEVPVVLVEGVPRLRLRIYESQLERALDEALRGTPVAPSGGGSR